MGPWAHGLIGPWAIIIIIIRCRFDSRGFCSIILRALALKPDGCRPNVEVCGQVVPLPWRMRYGDAGARELLAARRIVEAAAAEATATVAAAAVAAPPATSHGPYGNCN